MTQAMHIVAVGARTPLGSSAESSAAAARARISRIVMHPFMANQQNENVIGGLDSSFDPGILGRQRLVGLAHSALDEVVRKLLPNLSPDTELSALLALPETRPGFADPEPREVISALLSSTLSWERPVHIESFGRGHAGGLSAITEAARRLGEGKQELVLVGGVDSYFDFDTLDWLQEHRQLLNKVSRSGFPPGEGAAFVALCSDATRRKLRLVSLGTVRGFGVSREDKLIKTNDIVLGVGLSHAIAAATASLRLPDEAIDTIYCDINGERYRTEEWGFASMRLPHIARDFGYEPSGGSWGDLGAASGPVFCNLALQAWARGYAKGPRALVWCGSESGLRAAVVLEAPGA